MLYDGDLPLYRFKQNRAPVQAGLLFATSDPYTQQFFRGGWSSDRPSTCEEIDGGYRFWSAGRWIIVTW